jgi:ribosomal RNA-processing protein 7
MAPTNALSTYTLLPLAFPPNPSYPVHATQILYIRPNAPRIPTEADSRSLFILNLPIDATATHLKSIFATLLGSAGRVEDVLFNGDAPKSTAVTEIQKGPGISKKRKRGEEDEVPQELPRPWDREVLRRRDAVVVFVDSKSAEGALKAARKLSSKKKDKFPIWGQGIESKIPALGSARYAAHNKLRYPDPRSLQQNVDSYITSYNLAESQRAKAAAKARNVPDEDGFVTVTRGGRVGPAKQEEAERKRKEMEERGKERVGGAFYRFQVRERRKEEMGELVRGFEEDKKRVENMRERRGKGGFRPES